MFSHPVDSIKRHSMREMKSVDFVSHSVPYSGSNQAVDVVRRVKVGVSEYEGGEVSDGSE